MDEYIARTGHGSFAYVPPRSLLTALASHCSSQGVQLGTGSGHCLDSAMAAAGSSWEGAPGGNPVYSAPVPAVPKQPPADVAEKREIEKLNARLAVLHENKAARVAVAAALEARDRATIAALLAEDRAAAERLGSLGTAPKQAPAKSPPGWRPAQPKHAPPAPGPVAAKATQPTAF